MNGKVVKKIRRMVYGDKSLRVPREYEAVSSKTYRFFPKHISKYAKKIKQAITITHGILKNKGDSDRARYQNLKKRYIKGEMII